MKQAIATWIKQHRETLLLLLISAMVIAVIRIPSISNPRLQLRNIDERGMFESTLTPFLGVPPTWLGWPGGVMRYAMLIVTPLTFLIRKNTEISPDGFVKFLADYMTHWEYGVWVMRTLSTIFVAIGFASLAIPIKRLSGSAIFGVAGAIAASVVPAVWQRSLMGTSDGMGLGLLAISLCFATTATRSPKSTVFCGIFLGLAVGTKITMMLLGPVVLLAVLLAPTSVSYSRLRTFILFAFAGAISFVLTDPYLITEPIRSMKAIFGNLLLRNASGSLEGGLRIGISYWLLFLGLGGLVLALIRHDFRMASGPSITVFLTAMLVARSPQIDPHYFAPLVPMWAILAFGVLPTIVVPWICKQAKALQIGTTCILVVLIGVVIANGSRADRDAIGTLKEVYAPSFWCAEQADASPPGSRIALPPRPLNLVTSPLSTSSLKERINSEVFVLFSGEIRRRFAHHYQLPELPFVMLPSLFTENERLIIAKLQLDLARSREDGLDITDWADFPELQALVKIPTRDEVARDFRAGKYDMIITDDQLRGLTPAATFKGGKPVKYLYCYRKAK